MIDLTRRTLLTGTVASTAAAGICLAPGREARAAAPPAGTQAPGWYRYKVGNFEITVVTDGVNRFKFPDDIVANMFTELNRAGRPQRTEGRLVIIRPGKDENDLRFFFPTP